MMNKVMLIQRCTEDLINKLKRKVVNFLSVELKTYINIDNNIEASNQKRCQTKSVLPQIELLKFDRQCENCLC